MNQNEIWPILIIEDDFELSKVLGALIIMLGYKPYHCFDGRQALDLLIEKKLDPMLVICDVNMPEISGHEFIKYQLAKNLNLNICVLTGDDSNEAILKALRL